MPQALTETAFVPQLLDLLDITFRIHWATTAARASQGVVPGIMVGAVGERHYALNWLARFGGADWDDVEIPT